MLLVETYLDKSPISGTGCFAQKFIPKGTLIWQLNEFFDLVVTEREYDLLPLVTRKYLAHFAYFNSLEGGWVLCSDNAKYFNHSIFPNCQARGTLTFATKNIEAGEEIVEDYFVFDEKANEKLQNQ